jgi:PAS domain S-box-containing protein
MHSTDGDNPTASEIPLQIDLLLSRLAAIVESSDDAIISKDLNGCIMSWNQGAQRLFGYTAQEMIGQPVHRLIPQDRLDEEPRILERLRLGQRIDHYETVRQRKDGTMIDVSLSVSPIKDRGGRIVGASKVAREISERKQGERDLANLVEALPVAVYTTDAEGTNHALQSGGCGPLGIQTPARHHQMVRFMAGLLARRSPHAACSLSARPVPQAQSPDTRT